MGFLGQRLVLTGYNQYEQGKVWFVGLNLAYHVIRNHDDEALRLLDDLFTINQGQISEYESFPLYEYQTSGKEIRFAYCLEENTALLLPFSCYDGTVVKIDGKEQPVESFSNLIGMNAPAGIHYVQISFEPTRIYLFGKILSGFAIVMFIGTNLFWKEQENENG